MTASFYRTAGNVGFFVAAVSVFIFMYSFDYQPAQPKSNLTAEQMQAINDAYIDAAEKIIVTRKVRERLEEFKTWLDANERPLKALKTKLGSPGIVALSADEAYLAHELLWKLRDLRNWTIFNFAPGVHRPSSADREKLTKEFFAASTGKQDDVNSDAKASLEEFAIFLKARDESHAILRMKLSYEEITLSIAEANYIHEALRLTCNFQAWMTRRGIQGLLIPAVNPDLPGKPKTGPSGSALK